MYVPMAGPSDDSAANPGMFTSHLQFQVEFAGKTESMYRRKLHKIC